VESHLQIRIAVLVSGASGMKLPQILLRELARNETVDVIHLVLSKGASQVLHHELGKNQTGALDLLKSACLDSEHERKVVIHRDSALDAPIASGSYPLTGTVVLPCSAGTLGALATGSARTLVHRAGAVALKERWPLILGFRETPLSIVHIENMRRLAYAGATLIPPVPAFYIGGEDFDTFVAHYTLRIFDQLGINETGREELRWGG
jgi:4-hydroxy-3-polyprenylbenzoate decarboxylase